MRQMSVISGHPIFTGFYELTGCQRDPRDRGVTVRSLGLCPGPMQTDFYQVPW